MLTPKPFTCAKFVSYLCQNQHFTNRVTADSVGIAYPAIAETKLAAFDVAVPPLPEQKAIVRFLDHTTEQIERYIRAKEKLIGAPSRVDQQTSLIGEYRTRLIADVVTGKLDVRKAVRSLSDRDSTTTIANK